MALDAAAATFSPRLQSDARAELPPTNSVSRTAASEFYQLKCLPFLPPDNSAADSELAAFTQQDVSALLRMPYAHFLSLMVYDQGVRKMVDTFLQHRQRAYESIGRSIASAAPEGQANMKALSGRVLLLLVRLVGGEHESLSASASGGSASPFGEYASLGELLYSEWVFDVAKLLDIVALFGRSCPAVVGALLKNLFAIQPAYYGDLAEALGVVARTLQEVSSRVQQLHDGSVDAAAPGVGTTDLHRYLVDITVSLAELFKAYPDTCYCLMRSAAKSQTAQTTGLLGAELLTAGSLLHVLLGVYETTLPQLHTLVIRGGECPHSAAAQRSGLIRTHILDAVHVVMCHCYFLPLGVEVRGFQYPGSLGEEAPPTQGPSTAVSRVQVHPDAVSEALAALLGALLAGGIRGASGGRASFPADYAAERHLLHHLRQLQLERSLCSLDPTRLAALETRVQDAVSVAAENVRRSRAASTRAPPTAVRSHSGVTSSDLAEMVAQVKELMPDYSAGYIEKCLRLTGYAVQDVVHRLLENDMPSSSKIDAALAEAQRDATPSTKAANDSGAARGSKKAGWWRKEDQQEDDFLETMAQGAADVEFKRAQLIRLHSFDEYDDDYDDAFDEEGFNVDATGVEQGGDNGEDETKAGGLSLLEEDDEDVDDLMRPNNNRLAPLPARSRRSNRTQRRGTPSKSSGTGAGAGAGGGAGGTGGGGAAGGGGKSTKGRAVAPPDARRKQVNKSSRANHSRRRGAASKLRRGMGGT